MNHILIMISRAVFALFWLGYLISYGNAEDNHLKETAWHTENCLLCGDYEYCRVEPSFEVASSVLKSFYEKRGFKVGSLKRKGRFIQTEIYDNNKIVDKILLDLRTGRIRSMY